MDERDLTLSDTDRAWYEREDLRHAYHRSRIEMRETQAKAQRTGKVPLWFLEDDEDWTLVPMDDEFWCMVIGGLHRLRQIVASEGAA